MDDFRGRTALVTGASKGIGRALAVDLARRGADVILVARAEQTLLAVADDIRTRFPAVTVTPIPADLGTPDGTGRLLEALGGHSVDLLINNAGMGTAGPFLISPLERHQSSIDLNITGLTRLTYDLGRSMIERGSGGIVNVASTAAFQPLPYQASYGATKAFVLSFTEALAEELRGTGVHVMAAHPGATDTSFFDTSTMEVNPAFSDTPDRVAADILDDYARRHTASYPGRFTNQAMTVVARFLPRRTVTKLAAALNRKLGLHEARDLTGAPG
ncbi:SDR family NAD(P)-dependent oxidoreductase [Actinoplanes couchii]|uniref:Dehydrogenase n=1 Tax=Actinoplanes couchii TaxID=403638 RepID=A0ABQ3XK67_9ACTN|nr:SDR family oxidoreductase [Actinoplanes couchii]MDR6320464.1 short-subunit dehydrogenase [Actinoplanes couchii]GID58867.1 dehydrogenase [Actinoplanes couchii]